MRYRWLKHSGTFQANNMSVTCRCSVTVDGDDVCLNSRQTAISVRMPEKLAKFMDFANFSAETPPPQVFLDLLQDAEPAVREWMVGHGWQW